MVGVRIFSARYLMAFGLGFSLFSCQFRGYEVVANSTGFNDRPAIIFLHGYYGSALRDQSTKRPIFLTVPAALWGPGAISLFQRELSTPPGPTLEVEGMLGGVSVVPFLYGSDVYGGFFKKMRRQSEVQVISFAYDWRQDLFSAVSQLDQTVQQLRAAGVRSITIAAHSMGGLVATYYLAYGSQSPEIARLNWAGASQVRNAIFLGVPFGGVFGILRNMQQGPPVFWSKRLLPGEAVASFPSSYHLLPYARGSFRDKAGEILPVNMADIQLWRKHRLGLLHFDGFTGETRVARENFVNAQLNAAALFVKRISLQETSPEPPRTFYAYNVIGHGRPTVDSAFYLPETNALVFDTDHPEKLGLPANKLYADGDGTVTLAAAATPLGLEPFTQVISTRTSHELLFADEKVQDIMRKLTAD